MLPMNVYPFTLGAIPRAKLQIEGGIEDNLNNFSDFSMKTYVVTPH